MKHILASKEYNQCRKFPEKQHGDKLNAIKINNDRSLCK